MIRAYSHFAVTDDPQYYEVETKPFDHHCPQIPGGLNLHAASCRVKQAKGGPCASIRCREGSALVGKEYVEPSFCPTCGRESQGICSPCQAKEKGRKKKIARIQKQLKEIKQFFASAGPCDCGLHVKAETLKRHGVPFALCPACLSRYRGKQSTRERLLKELGALL